MVQATRYPLFSLLLFSATLHLPSTLPDHSSASPFGAPDAHSGAFPPLPPLVGHLSSLRPTCSHAVLTPRYLKDGEYVQAVVEERGDSEGVGSLLGTCRILLEGLGFSGLRKCDADILGASGGAAAVGRLYASIHLDHAAPQLPGEATAGEILSSVLYDALGPGPPKAIATPGCVCIAPFTSFL